MIVRSLKVDSVVLLCVLALAGCSTPEFVELVVEVDRESAVPRETERVAVRLNSALESEGLTGFRLESGAGEIEIGAVSPGLRSKLSDVVTRELPEWEVSAGDDDGLRLTAPAATRASWLEGAVGATVAALSGEESTLGKWPVEAQPVDGSESKVRLRLTGTGDGARVAKLIDGPPLGLRMHEVGYSDDDPRVNGALPAPVESDVVAMLGGRLPADTTIVRQTIEQPGGFQDYTMYWPVKIVPIFAAREVIRTGTWVNEMGDVTVTYDLSAEAGERNTAVTQRNVGRQMVVITGDGGKRRVVMAPRIVVPIGAGGLISSDFDLEGAEDFAFRWRLEALPARVRVSG